MLRVIVYLWLVSAFFNVPVYACKVDMVSTENTLAVKALGPPVRRSLKDVVSTRIEDVKFEYKKNLDVRATACPDYFSAVITFKFVENCTAKLFSSNDSNQIARLISTDCPTLK